jgi:hypothetical protein
MYKGFCVSEDTILDLDLYDIHYEDYTKALEELDKKSEMITKRIASILNGDANGVIDSEALQQVCMPTKTEQYDVFISHSHLSEDSAKYLAVYLYLKYGVKCFVDEFVWGSCDNDILRPIDNRWSTHGTKKGCYSYEKRNFSTSHVHVMLSMALLEMMDSCECCIFIKPEQEYSLSSIEDYTLSPWIYEEITMFNKIKGVKPSRITRCNESFSAIDTQLKIRYKLDLSDMPELEEAHLKHYVGSLTNDGGYTRAYRWLDYLYDNV